MVRTTMQSYFAFLQHPKTVRKRVFSETGKIISFFCGKSRFKKFHNERKIDSWQKYNFYFQIYEQSNFFRRYNVGGVSVKLRISWCPFYEKLQL